MRCAGGVQVLLVVEILEIESAISRQSRRGVSVKGSAWTLQSLMAARRLTRLAALAAPLQCARGWPSSGAPSLARRGLTASPASLLSLVGGFSSAASAAPAPPSQLYSLDGKAIDASRVDFAAFAGKPGAPRPRTPSPREALPASVCHLSLSTAHHCRYTRSTHPPARSADGQRRVQMRLDVEGLLGAAELA